MKYLSTFLLSLVLILTVRAGPTGMRKGHGNGRPQEKEQGGKPNNNQNGPLNSCETQSACLETEITPIIDNEYEVCIWWDSRLQQCRKDNTDSISHVCYGENEFEKEENCNSGEENKICRRVPCGDYASFGVKDGSECAPNESDQLTISGYAFSGVEGIICKAGTQGGMCNGGAKKDCVWMVPVPDCVQTPQTTSTNTQTTVQTQQSTEIENVICIPIESMSTTCVGLNQEICDSPESPSYCMWDFESNMCGTQCAYDVDVCEDCGCSKLGGDCIADEVVDGVLDAAMRMRIDEYVSDEYDANVGDDVGDGDGDEWIKGVENKYVLIGGVGFVGMMLVVLVGVGVYKYVSWRRNKYVEMDGDDGDGQGNVTSIHQIQMQMNREFNAMNTVNNDDILR